MHSSSLLSTYYVPGTIPDFGDIVVNLTEAHYILVGETVSKSTT